MNPILLELPEEFETERLVLRPPRRGDGPAIFATVQESLPELRPWMPWADSHKSVGDSETFARRAYARFLSREDLTISMFRKSDGLYLGGTGMHRINWEVPSLEIGYWLRTSCVGNGYATEAVKGLTWYAFEIVGAKRLEIRCATTNARSRAVIERAGFTYEGELRDDRIADGKLCGTYVYSLLPHEYTALNRPPAGWLR